jgi:dTDP-4-dehydrorhamnose reductase
MESTDEFEGYGPNTAVYFSLDKLQVIDNSVTIPTKINDLTAEISVYPNPFAESIIVNTTSEGKVTVYDLSGRVVLSATVQAGENKINTSTLNKGVYILKQGLNTVKIVK